MLLIWWRTWGNPSDGRNIGTVGWAQFFTDHLPRHPLECLGLVPHQQVGSQITCGSADSLHLKGCAAVSAARRPALAALLCQIIFGTASLSRQLGGGLGKCALS